VKVNLNDPSKASEYFKARMEFTTGPVELSHMLEQRNENINVVDVRASDDYTKGHVPRAISLPQDQWTTFKGLRKDKLNILYCYTPSSAIWRPRPLWNSQRMIFRSWKWKAASRLGKPTT